MEMADRLVDQGYKDLGYEFVNIDVHSRGLKLGIYGDIGTMTCGGYPGSYGHIETDAMTYAEWGVDMVKVDGCYANETVFAEGYPAMGKALNATGRPIVYSCSWPAYLKDPDYATISKTCNLWRNYDDIQDSWDSVLSIILHYAEGQDVFGNLDQQMSQMAMWAIFASPLLMSNDLWNIPEDSREILQNPEVIAVNQDKLGVQGKLVSSSTTSHPHSPKETTLYVFAKPLSTGSVAVALLNTDDQGTPRNMTVSLQEAGLKVTSARVRDLFELKDIGVFNSKVTLSVNPSGGVRLLLLTPVSP
ncbi:Alpha-N-acetylgalactosaminidase [Geodia barretti]|nr:Alpha-N-acetylgalactosaminidase [Geodia barretti]